MLYRLASGLGSLTEQNQAAVHELVQQGFIENRVRGKLGEYDPTDPRLLTLMVSHDRIVSPSSVPEMTAEFSTVISSPLCLLLRC